LLGLRDDVVRDRAGLVVEAGGARDEHPFAVDHGAAVAGQRLERRARRDQLAGHATRSSAIAVASPPPMHSAATPRLRPRPSSASIKATMSRAPVAPTGWPSAQAPP